MLSIDLEVPFIELLSSIREIFKTSLHLRTRHDFILLYSSFFFPKYELISAQNTQALHLSVSIWNKNLIIPLVLFFKGKWNKEWMNVISERYTFLWEEKKSYWLQGTIFLHTLIGHRLSVIACIHLVDLIEISDITSIRCQDLPDYMMEGSEGEACKKCISLLEQLN